MVGDRKLSPVWKRHRNIDFTVFSNEEVEVINSDFECSDTYQKALSRNYPTAPLPTRHFQTCQATVRIFHLQSSKVDLPFML